MASLLDRCMFVPTSGGTGTWTVSSAVTGYMTPAQAGAVNATTYYYGAESSDKSQWELGLGTYTVSGTTLARTGVLYSSNANAVVNFTNPPNVFITLLAENKTSSSDFGLAKVDGTSITASSGIISAISRYPAFTTPVNGGFAWVNQGGASVTVNANGGIYLSCPKNSGNSIRIRKQSAPGSTPYTVIMAFYPYLMFSQNCGFLIRESSSGKMLQIALDMNTGTTGFISFVIAKFTNETTFSSAPVVRATVAGSGAIWVKYYDDGTNRHCYYGFDGYNFIELFSEARTTFLTADEIGFFSNDTGNAIDTGMTLLSWSVS
jgi:hypothetical protein